jgi:hypothetical protein
MSNKTGNIAHAIKEIDNYIVRHLQDKEQTKPVILILILLIHVNNVFVPHV